MRKLYVHIPSSPLFFSVTILCRQVSSLFPTFLPDNDTY